MKKLLFSAMLIAFAVGVQAGDGKSCCGDKEQASCCAKTKVSEQTKSECSMAKQAKASCPADKNAAKETANKQALLSPKALADARR